MKGTTVTHTFKLRDVPLTQVEALFVTYRQRGENIVEKSLDEVEIDGKKIIVKLSQEDTLKFSPKEKVKWQIRGRLINGTAWKTVDRNNEIPVSECYKRGVI